MAYTLGWYSDPVPYYFEPANADLNGGQISPYNTASVDIDMGFYSLICGVRKTTGPLTTEVIVYSTEWVPVGIDPEPYHYGLPVGDANLQWLRINSGPEIDVPYTLSVGTLTIIATVDGVPLTEALRVVYTTDGWYGHVAYDVLGVTTDFSGTPLISEPGQPVTFTDLTSPAADTWLWDFGDSTTSDQENPVHAYAAVGSYTVTLTALVLGADRYVEKIAYITVVAGAAEGCSTALSFPPSLPMPTIAGFSSSHEVAASSTEPDFGPNRVRPLYTNVPRKVSAQWEFHDYQFLRFDKWYLDTVQNGTEKFDVMLSDDDDGSMWWSTCFAKPWSVEQVQPGNMWRVSAEMYLYCGFEFRPFYGNLDGIATIDLSATGNLNIQKQLIGVATLDLTATGIVSGGTATLYGDADAMTLVATAIFGAVSTGPLWGLATMDYELTASLFDGTFELREDGGNALREDGGREQREV